MIEAMVFRRCKRCSKRMPARRCACGSESFSWTFRVDIAERGSRAARFCAVGSRRRMLPATRSTRNRSAPSTRGASNSRG